MRASIVSDDRNTAITADAHKWMGDDGTDDVEYSMMRELFDIVEDEAGRQRREAFSKGRRSVLRKPNEFLNKPKEGT
jgi:hypothetical protein